MTSKEIGIGLKGGYGVVSVGPVDVKVKTDARLRR
jgi:hypothetical protein